MNKQVQLVAIHSTGGATVTTVDIGAGKAGAAQKIRAQGQMVYELRSVGTGTAPDQIIVRRRGKNLEILLEANGDAHEADQAADIVLEGYYDHTDSRLVGLTEGGDYQNYVPQEGVHSLLSWEMADGAVSYQSLGHSDASAGGGG